MTQATQAILPNSQVGFEVFDRTTSTVLTSQNAGQQFASMSVVKVLIALDALSRDNWATPDGATQQQLHQMLANSDDHIADTLWTADGGPAIVTRMANLLGLTWTQPPGDPGEWGDTLITPEDMVTVYRYITDQLPKPDQDIILGALSDAPKIAADGSDQYFGIPDGMPHTTWAIKQGWGTSGSQAAMNSTGLIGTDSRYVVVVLTSAPENSYTTLPAVVTAAASALTNLLTTTS
ncbi:MAG: serine hydrolase [Pseudonocardiaceae bacterium]